MNRSLELKVHGYLEGRAILSSEVIPIPNKEKYGYAEGMESNASLDKIFSFMSSLNKIAVTDNNICRGESGPSLREVVIKTAGSIKNHIGSVPVKYIEVGPEPYKTSLLMSSMESRGVEISEYVGLDINPRSRNTMEEALKGLLPEQEFSYIVKDYNEVDREEFGNFEGRTIITMLGFQEGNETPEKMQSLLKRITRSGDILISEMQVLGDSGVEGIVDFYKLAEMKSFSKMVCVRENFKPIEGHKIFMAPIQSNLGEVFTIATLVPVHSSGKKHLALTNCCLKYSREQFRSARTKNGYFRILDEIVTGDKTVVYQISERKLPS